MKTNERSAGVLMPISSFPGIYGIGDMGKESREFIDWMKRSGMRNWSILPINPTSYGNSPYQSVSAFAGNPYFISPDMLMEEGLLEEADICKEDYKTGSRIDYGKVFRTRPVLLKKAYGHFLERGNDKHNPFQTFCGENAWWLDDYAAFMACKEHNGFIPWWEWEPSLAFRRGAAYSRFIDAHAKDIERWKFIQYEFFGQWKALREYTNSNGIEIIGDMPFYVAPDSADVWCRKELFEVDPKSGRTMIWAGVPEDDHRDEVRNWGNPVYNWNAHAAADYDWFRNRIRMAAELFDSIRIDHVIALRQYFGILDGEQQGRWYDGPDSGSHPLSDALDEEAKNAQVTIIAEDLGKVMPGLREMMQKKGWLGMRVLQYAFTEKYGADSNHLPFYHREDMAVYTGTHDNLTLKEYLDSKSDKELTYFKWWSGCRSDSREELAQAMIREAYKSPAAMVILPIQDILGLGEESRMVYLNDCDRSWLWRLDDMEMLKAQTAEEMKALAVLTGRFPCTGQDFLAYLNRLM